MDLDDFFGTVGRGPDTIIDYILEAIRIFSFVDLASFPELRNIS